MAAALGALLALLGVSVQVRSLQVSLTDSLTCPGVTALSHLSQVSLTVLSPVSPVQVCPCRCTPCRCPCLILCSLSCLTCPGVSVQVRSLQVSVPEPRTVALLFQPVLLRCHFQVSSPGGPAPIVTWKYKSFCPDTWAASPGGAGRDSPGEAAGACPDSARTVRIVATKQGEQVTLGDFYLGRAVTIRGAAELSLGPAAWGDSGLYLCTVTSTSDLQGNNEAVAELVVLGSLPEGSRLLPEGTLPDWLFVVLVALGAGLVALGAGLCWCQCCPHTCCCYLRCPCCPRTCCCPEALYLAGKAATAGGAFGPAPTPALPLQLLGSSQSSQVPLLRDSDSSTVPPPLALRFLEQQLQQPWGGGGARAWSPERRLEPREPRGVTGTPQNPGIFPEIPELSPKSRNFPQIPAQFIFGAILGLFRCLKFVFFVFF
ncbi:lipolysis-stimulated lipoprotein receptor-like isoform X3 [Agelaius phoeniceus]|uniref:lipolysis-stimulated lipoprotein receptor-like isoform X3 n=1 Tax=Agelaius phoeniceus TaxID=39638 RepID=UPI004054D0CF